MSLIRWIIQVYKDAQKLKSIELIQSRKRTYR